MSSIIDDDLAVSPVIGVIFMVAVTLIIAATIGATAFGLGSSLLDSPPQANLDTTQEDIVLTDADGESAEFTTVTFTHDGGDSIDKEDIEITVDGTPAYATLDPADEFYDSFDWYDMPHILEPWDSVGSDQINSGDQTIIAIRTNEIENGEFILGQDIIVYRFTGDQAVQIPSGGPLQLNKDEVELESGETVRMTWESDDRSVLLAEHKIK